jgi:hypothetical protein
MVTHIEGVDEMSKMFIGDDRLLNVLIKSLKLNISKEEQNQLVSELYPHIEHTRILSFKNGYDQGRFDEKIDINSH